MSSETKWTSGDWKLGRNDYITSSSGEYVALVCADNETMDANARLIASAPKLYEALSALTDWAAWSYPQTETYAEEFARETGMLAPFKDMGAVADEAEELRVVRTEEWRAWLSRKRAALIAAARTALASARGEG